MSIASSHAYRRVDEQNLVVGGRRITGQREHGCCGARGTTGGRISERTSAGVEFEWARSRCGSRQGLAYLWHLRQDRADATEVELPFVDQGDLTTRVEIEHRGWIAWAPRSKLA